MPTIGVTVEVPEGTDSPEEYAARLAMAFGKALLDSQKEEIEGLSETQAVAGKSVTREAPLDALTYEGDPAQTKLRSLMGEIAENTRKALYVIAEANLARGPIHAIELREALGAASPSVVAGYLTSLGFAEKRTGLPKPYKQGWKQKDGIWGNVYTMSPKVAEAIVEMIEGNGTIRTSA